MQCLDDRLKEFIRDGGQVPGEEMLTEGQQSLGSAAELKGKALVLLQCHPGFLCLS